MKTAPTTKLCTHTLTSMYYRDADLVDELLGKKGFVEVMFAQIMGREARPVDVRIIDAVLVALLEHGMTPSAITARLVYMSAPESLQGAVASGLQAVGSQFVGTMENCAALLGQIVSSASPGDTARDLATDYRKTRRALPGFGHHLHKPDDPRAIRMLGLADAEADLAGTWVHALRCLGEAVDDVYGKHVTINATGASAALLGEIGVPVPLMRGFAVISRAAGLVAHIAEERQEPSGRYIWDLVDQAIPYMGAAPHAKKDPPD